MNSDRQELPLLSVIVPVYGVEKFLPACLDSLLAETYSNMEIIVVNDGSPDNSEEIILDYAKYDSRIKYVKSPENQGLFAARLRGYEVATGEYICSVDSDDTVGIDYHRVLMKKVLETDADIVVSKFVINRIEKKEYQYRTYGNYAIEDCDLCGDNILLDFFRTQGRTSHRFLVWNKIYKKSLWDECYPDLLLMTRHQTMLEDLIYGIHFMSKAKRYVFVDCDAYFYAKHQESSTASDLPYEKFAKYIDDITAAMQFVEDYLKRIDRYEAAEDFLNHIQNVWQRTWTKLVNNSSLALQQKLQLRKSLKHLSKSVFEKDTDDPYFYYERTPWDRRFEDIKKQIINPDTEYISFDIFDTLILRPFYAPTDLFRFIENDFRRLTGRDAQSFCNFRVSAEKTAREYQAILTPAKQEVTLNEIYATLSEMYDIDASICEELKSREISLEMQFCTSRKSMYELYELALHLGKPMICISDMYLPKEVIRSILNKNGYTEIKELYVSSDISLTKSSGDLYEFVSRKLNCKPKSILHIGDNWKSDIEVARRKGLSTYFVPKPMDLLLNKIPDYKHQKMRSKISDLLMGNSAGNYVGFFYAKEFLGIRCMIALTANKIFDNPFLPYIWETNFNCNPYYIGYFALGMHGVGLAKWVYDSARADEKTHVNFVARDGYVTKGIFDILCKQTNSTLQSNYIYMSRKSTLPLAIIDKASLYELRKYINLENFSIRELLTMLKEPLNINLETDEMRYRSHGVLFDSRIKSENEFVAFVKAVHELSFDEQKLMQFRTAMKSYFNSVLGSKGVMFDIGYSGRAQALLTILLGRPIDAYYIHNNGPDSDERSLRLGFKISTFFKHRPPITGKMRELIQSEIAPSCIGYSISEHNVSPLFEPFDMAYPSRFVLERIHQGAFDMATDFFGTFTEYLNDFVFAPPEVSVAHEFFLQSPTPIETGIFSIFDFEDDILAGYKTRRMNDIWWEDLRRTRLLPHNRQNTMATVNNPGATVNNPGQDELLKRQSIFYTYKHDRKHLKDAVWLKLQSHPVAFHLARGLYRTAKRIWNPHAAKKSVMKTKPLQRQVNQLEIPKSNNKNIDSLYQVTSSYNLLCACLHVLKYNKGKQCTCLLSDYRNNLYKNVVTSGIFDDVILFEDRSLRQFTKNVSITHPQLTEDIENSVLKEVSNRLHINLENCKEIYVGNDTMPIGAFLVSRFLKYNVFEEAVGLYSRPLPLQESIKNNFPTIEKELIEKYQTLHRNGCVEKRYINVSAQVGDYDKQNIVDFNASEILEGLSREEMNKVLSVFGASPLKIAPTTACSLLLTYPLMAREGLSKEEQRNVFLQLADYYMQSEVLHIKPHPDDNEDYTTLFPNAVIIQKTVISELLPYVTGVRYKCAVTAVSASIGNLLNIIDNPVVFGTDFRHYCRKLHKYFAASVLIGEYIERNNLSHCTIAVSEHLHSEPLEKMLRFSSSACNAVLSFVSIHQDADIAVIAPDEQYRGGEVAILRFDDNSEIKIRTYFRATIQPNGKDGSSFFMSFSKGKQLHDFNFIQHMKYQDADFEIREVQ